MIVTMELYLRKPLINMMHVSTYRMTVFDLYPRINRKFTLCRSSRRNSISVRLYDGLPWLENFSREDATAHGKRHAARQALGKASPHLASVSSGYVVTCWTMKMADFLSPTSLSRPGFKQS